MGDIAQVPVQLERTAWISSFDVLPLVSMATKRTLVERAVEDQSLLIGCHLPSRHRAMTQEAATQAEVGCDRMMGCSRSAVLACEIASPASAWLATTLALALARVAFGEYG